MTQVLITTSRRNSPADSPSGELIVYEVETQQVIRRCEIIEPPHKELDPNPRGGFRGLKGINISNGMIALANASTIFLYDANWTPIRYFWHPSCAGIHDIVLHGDSVWVTSTRNDLVFRFSLEGIVQEVIDVRTFVPALGFAKWKVKPLLTQQQLLEGVIDFRNPLSHKEATWDSAHVNSITFLHSGEMLFSLGLMKSNQHMLLMKFKAPLIKYGVWKKIQWFNNFLHKKMPESKKTNVETLVMHPTPGSSAVIHINKDRHVENILFLKGTTSPCHSVMMLKDGSATYLDTTHGELVHFSPDTGEILETFRVGKQFLRGSVELADGILLIGDNTRVLHFDLQEKRVVSSTLISDDSSNAIFGFHVLPEGFKLPPVSFNDHHARLMPVKQY